MCVLFISSNRNSVAESLCDGNDTNPVYSGEMSNEVTNKQYAILNARYQKHASPSSDHYEAMTQKQDMSKKLRPISHHSYCYIDDITLPRQDMSSEKKLGTIKSDVVPLSDEYSSSNEELTVYNTNYNKTISFCSKPTEAAATGAHNNISSGKSPPAKQYASLDISNVTTAAPPAKEYATLDLTSRTIVDKNPPAAMQYASLNPASRSNALEYQKTNIQSTDKPPLLPKEQRASSPNASNHEDKDNGEYQKLNHPTT